MGNTVSFFKNRNKKVEEPIIDRKVINDIPWDKNAKKSSNLYFAIPKMIESVDKEIRGIVALQALEFFTGMPTADFVKELEKIRAETATENGLSGCVDVFLEEECLIGQKFKTQSSVLYYAFCEWFSAKYPNFIVPSNKKLTQTLKTKLFQTKRVHESFILGVALKKETNSKR